MPPLAYGSSPAYHADDAPHLRPSANVLTRPIAPSTAPSGSRSKPNGGGGQQRAGRKCGVSARWGYRVRSQPWADNKVFEKALKTRKQVLVTNYVSVLMISCRWAPSDAAPTWRASSDRSLRYPAPGVWRLSVDKPMMGIFSRLNVGRVPDIDLPYE